MLFLLLLQLQELRFLVLLMMLLLLLLRRRWRRGVDMLQMRLYVRLRRMHRLGNGWLRK